MIDWNSLFIVVGTPILRSVGGWVENALKDGKIDTFEWAQLGSTVVRVGIIGGAAFIGFNAVGFDVPALATGAGTIVFDYLICALKTPKTLKSAGTEGNKVYKRKR